MARRGVSPRVAQTEAGREDRAFKVLAGDSAATVLNSGQLSEYENK